MQTRKTSPLLLNCLIAAVSPLAFGPAALAAADAPAEAPGAAPAPFNLFEIRVLGNTALPQAEVERAVYPSLGEQRTIKDVETARDALVAAYQSHGYGAVYVDIPEQDVNDGLVRLKVTEGRIDRVKLSGARYFENGRIRAALPALAKGQVVNVAQLQEQMAAVNRESRDRTVVPVLRAGRTPGTVDIDVKVADNLPLHASLDVNNRYTANTSQTRVGMNLSYDNLFQRFHSLSLQYQTAPSDPSQTRVLAATYLMPLTRTEQLAMYIVDTNSDVAAVGTLSVLGAGRIYGARYIMNLASPTASLQQNFTLGMDYKDFSDQIRLVGSTDVTPIKYMTWSANYAASFSTHSTSTGINLTGTFGLRHLVNSNDDFQYKRYRARGNFFYVRFSAQHERPLVFGTRLFAKLGSQLANEPLISNEQLSLGGSETVRGYLESEALGDVGLDGGLEFRSPQLAPMLGSRVSNAYVFLFAEGGYSRILQALPGQIDRYDLASYGAGLRFNGFGKASASLDWAMARSRGTHTRAGDSRIHFDVTYAF